MRHCTPGIRHPSVLPEPREQIRPRQLCERFSFFVRDSPNVGDTRPRILAWIEGLDDELLLVAAEMSGRPEASEHVGRSWISEHSHPLGSGRSVPELIEALHSAGILAPSTEELVPGSYGEWDAQRNPAFDYGRMLTWSILKQANASGVFSRSFEGPGGMNQ